MLEDLSSEVNCPSGIRRIYSHPTSFALFCPFLPIEFRTSTSFLAPNSLQTILVPRWMSYLLLTKSFFHTRSDSTQPLQLGFAKGIRNGKKDRNAVHQKKKRGSCSETYYISNKIVRRDKARAELNWRTIRKLILKMGSREGFFRLGKDQTN